MNSGPFADSDCLRFDTHRYQQVQDGDHAVPSQRRVDLQPVCLTRRTSTLWTDPGKNKVKDRLILLRGFIPSFFVRGQ